MKNTLLKTLCISLLALSLMPTMHAAAGSSSSYAASSSSVTGSSSGDSNGSNVLPVTHNWISARRGSEDKRAGLLYGLSRNKARQLFFENLPRITRRSAYPHPRLVINMAINMISSLEEKQLVKEYLGFSIQDLIDYDLIPQNLERVLDLGLMYIDDLSGIDNLQLSAAYDDIGINLSDNRIFHIPKGIFGKSMSLKKRLDMSRNPISVLHQEAFAGLDNLEILDLSGNNISFINDNAFLGLKKLKELDLRLNNKFMISIDTFNGLDNLKKLDLSNNEIARLDLDRLRRINPFVFSKLENLEELNLSHNNLSSVDISTFIGLNNLKKLNLSHNMLSIIPSGTFWDLNQLNSLFLSFNPIYDIAENMFSPYNKLRVIYLNHTQIPEEKKNDIIEKIDVRSPEARIYVRYPEARVEF